MKVKELIEKLQQYDLNTDVSFIVYDGSDYSDNVCVCNPLFLHYKSINELIIDLTNWYNFTDYDSEKYNRLLYNWSKIEQ